MSGQMQQLQERKKANSPQAMGKNPSWLDSCLEFGLGIQPGYSVETLFKSNGI